ncbi:DUF445 domain-containing protein [Rhodoferax sp.]|uniref:DUF445 domain-containing protein n=1 Tax=Rhodoferax sp. TaxID=50421 RepID=UPI00374D8679
MASPPDPRRQSLRRMQWFAIALLLASLCGLLLSQWMGGLGGWGWLRAFCEASAVGALADWFAVVALFRHPLGLPLPHTAIIPQSKERIADSLADFVRDHFLDPKTLLAKLAVLDPAQRLGEWLRDPARVGFWVKEARGWALGTLNMFDDERMQRATLELVVAQARRWDAAATAGEVLGLLTQGGRHNELLDAGLLKVGDFLAQDEVKAAVAQLVLKHVRKEWPKVVSMVDAVASTSKMADSLADKLSASALAELRDVMAQPEHPVRLRYEAWLTEYIQRLRDDPALRQACDDLKEKALTDPALRSFVASLWTDIKQLLQSDLADPESAIARNLEGALRTVGERLASDASLREAINEHVMAAAGQLALSLRSGVTAHISQTIKGWDDRQLVQELELSVGRDLQFIRISGTLVGGLAGLAIHALVLWAG